MKFCKLILTLGISVMSFSLYSSAAFVYDIPEYKYFKTHKNEFSYTGNFFTPNQDIIFTGNTDTNYILSSGVLYFACDWGYFGSPCSFTIKTYTGSVSKEFYVLTGEYVVNATNLFSPEGTLLTDSFYFGTSTFQFVREGIVYVDGNVYRKGINLGKIENNPIQLIDDRFYILSGSVYSQRHKKMPSIDAKTFKPLSDLSPTIKKLKCRRSPYDPYVYFQGTKIKYYYDKNNIYRWNMTNLPDMYMERITKFHRRSKKCYDDINSY